MPHLSDGELHTYLDGALELLGGGRAEEIREHLRTCDACRSRLSAERELLERSAAILDAGAPAVAEAPPLEELRERARIREERVAEERGRRWRAMPRTQALTWAATVVLALGIGWVTRDLTGVRSPVSRPAVEAGSVGAPAEAGPPGEGRALAGARDADAGVSAAEDGGAERLEGRPPPSEAAPGPQSGTRSRDEGAAGAGAVGERGRESAIREPGPERLEPAAAAAPEVEGATVVGRVLDDASLEPLGGAAVVLEDSTGFRHAGVLTQSDGRFVLRADRPGTYRAVVDLIGYARTRTDFFELSPDDTVARDVRAPARAIRLDEITVTGVSVEEAKAAEGAALRRVPESAAAAAADVVAEAERNRRLLDPEAYEGMAGTPELASSHVPGLPVVRVDPQTEPFGFVIVQRLASGDTLRLRWVAGAAPGDDDVAGLGPILEPLPEGWSQIVVRRGNGWLVARAPLGEEDLRALLSRGR